MGLFEKHWFGRFASITTFDRGHWLLSAGISNSQNTHSHIKVALESFAAQSAISLSSACERFQWNTYYTYV